MNKILLLTTISVLISGCFHPEKHAQNKDPKCSYNCKPNSKKPDIEYYKYNYDKDKCNYEPQWKQEDCRKKLNRKYGC